MKHELLTPPMPQAQTVRGKVFTAQTRPTPYGDPSCQILMMQCLKSGLVDNPIEKLLLNYLY
jgi:hypothetical protein